MEYAAGNWTKKILPRKGGIEWIHKDNPKMKVGIYILPGSKGVSQIYVLHTHPAPNREVILQYPENPKTMQSAMAKAKVHLKHWNNSKLWESDSDFGKLGLKP